MCSTMEGVQYVRRRHAISTDEDVEYMTTKTAEGVLGCFIYMAE